jgi:ATP-dependent DNA helicase Rep
MKRSGSLAMLIAHHFINRTQYKDYAILYRGNHQSRDPLKSFLMQNRIPYRISGGTSFFSRPESQRSASPICAC